MSNEVHTFINGDRRVHYIEVPDDQLDAYVAELQQRVAELRKKHDDDDSGQR